MIKKLIPVLVILGLLIPTVAQAKKGLRIKVNTLQDRSRLFKRGGFEHFKVRLRLQGDRGKMKRVKKVTYHLHPLFKRPDITTRDRQGKFGLNIWTWGEFRVDATVQYKNGRHESIKGHVTVAPRKANKRSLLNRLLYGKTK